MVRCAAVLLQCITLAAVSRETIATRSCVDWTATANGEVRGILQSFEACTAAYWELAALIPHSLRGVHDATPSQRVQLHGQKWVEKTLVDKTLGMADYLEEAIGLQPITISTAGVGPVVRAVVAAVAERGGDIICWRAAQQTAVQRVADSLAGANAALLALVPPHGRHICKGLNYAFMYVACEVIQYVDRRIVDTMLLGFMPTGEVPPGGRYRKVVEGPVEPFDAAENSELFDMVSSRLSQAARRARARGTDSSEWKDLETLWANVVGDDGEVAKGLMDGGPDGMGYTRRQIWEMYKEAPGGPRCLLRFGVQQGGKLRGCDDGALCGHNERTQMHETIHCIRADFPAALAREFYKLCPADVCKLGTDDVEAAYRRVLNARPWHTVIAVWDVRGDGGVRYFAMPGFPFGLRSAVVAFNRVEEFFVEMARVIMLVACGHYYDDVVTCEPHWAGGSGQRALWFIHKVVGIPLAARKHERMRFRNYFLGVMLDMAAKLGHVVIRVKESRRRKLLRRLREVLAEGKLSRAEAASLRGKLYFTSTTAFGGVGRAPLQALAERQYSKHGGQQVGDKLHSAIEAMIELLLGLPARQIPLFDRGRERCVYIWSDAMWEPVQGRYGEAVKVWDDETGEYFYIAAATLAFAVYLPWLDEWVYGDKDVGIETIRMMVPGKKTYIGQLEQLAAASVVYSLPEEWLRDRDGFMWIDNMGAKYSLQKGSARQDDSARIVDAFAKKVAQLRFRPWFEYVPSAQNIADLPSRGKWAQFAEVTAGRKARRVPMVVPDFSGWSSVSGGALRSSARKRRRGSRGGKGAHPG